MSITSFSSKNISNKMPWNIKYLEASSLVLIVGTTHFNGCENICLMPNIGLGQIFTCAHKSPRALIYVVSQFHLANKFRLAHNNCRGCETNAINFASIEKEKKTLFGFFMPFFMREFYFWRTRRGGEGGDDNRNHNIESVCVRRIRNCRLILMYSFVHACVNRSKSSQFVFHFLSWKKSKNEN